MASHFVDGATEYRESIETAPEHTVNSHMKSYTQIHRSGRTQDTGYMANAV